MPKLLIINPNSNTQVTENIAASLSPWWPMGVAIDCLTNEEGPDTISSDEDAAAAALDVARITARADADAILVACFSDPGVEALRAADPRPVFGVQEAGILMALSRAPRFGMIALSERAVPRHLARIERLGLMGRCAGELGLSGYSALAVGQSDDAFAESIETGKKLKGMGAGAIVLGCAGFGPRRAALQQALDVPVIDPVLAGVALAMAALIG